MSYSYKQTRKDDEDFTTSTFPDSNRRGKRFFKRQPSDNSPSNDSRRSQSRTPRRDSLDQKNPSYIRMPLDLLPSMTEIQQSVSHSINMQVNRLSHLNKRISISHGSDEPVHVSQRKIDGLTTDLANRNLELELMQEERERTRQQMANLQRKCRGLQEQNHLLGVELQRLTQDLTRKQIQNRKTNQDVQALQKKVTFLEKVQFTSDTKNIQTLRQAHLEGELESARTRLKECKTESETMLESQIRSLIQELFVCKRTCQTLQIGNDCLQKKLESLNNYATQQDNYMLLRTKYRKFLSQYKDLKKAYEVVQRQNKILKEKGFSTPEPDFSLEVSMFSIAN